MAKGDKITLGTVFFVDYYCKNESKDSGKIVKSMYVNLLDESKNGKKVNWDTPTDSISFNLINQNDLQLATIGKKYKITLEEQ